MSNTSYDSYRSEMPGQIDNKLILGTHMFPEYKCDPV